MRKPLSAIICRPRSPCKGASRCPRSDTHQPQEVLSRESAERFHTYQIQALAQARPDFLIATQLPALSEAEGIAHAMASVRLPYILSFAIRPTGTLLDGISLQVAIDLIDAAVRPAPLGYGVSGVAPSVLLKVLESGHTPGSSLIRRLVQFHADIPTTPVENLSHDVTDPHPFAVQMAEVRRRFGIPILGGGCATDVWHLEHIARRR